MRVKGFNKLLVETDELLTELDLVRDVGSSLGIANANWLFHPEHVGQVDPGITVGRWRQSTFLP